MSMSNSETASTSASSSSSSSSSSLGHSRGSVLRTLVTDAARHDIEETLDVQGILWMEHINLVVGSKSLAEHFYLNVLGCTRDAGKSFHVNLGQQQFHLAEQGNGIGIGERAQVISGSIGLVVPSLETLRERIAAATETATSQELFQGTQFGILSDTDHCVTLRGPWGNTFYIYSVQDDDHQLSKSAPATSTMKMVNWHAEGGAYGGHRMAVRGQPGIRFVEIACPCGKSPAVAEFYRNMLKCTVLETTQNDRACAMVCVGPGVHLAFVEEQEQGQEQSIPVEGTMAMAMEGVHVCFYANDFRELYHRLSERKLIWTNPRFVHLDTCDTWEEARASRTLRFKDIIDLSTGETILEMEHETRPLRHGQYLKVPKYDPK
jgi:catechol-2,3-dioxygenase